MKLSQSWPCTKLFSQCPLSTKLFITFCSHNFIFPLRNRPTSFSLGGSLVAKLCLFLNSFLSYFAYLKIHKLDNQFVQLKTSLFIFGRVCILTWEIHHLYVIDVSYSKTTSVIFYVLNSTFVFFSRILKFSSFGGYFFF